MHAQVARLAQGAYAVARQGIDRYTTRLNLTRLLCMARSTTAYGASRARTRTAHIRELTLVSHIKRCRHIRAAAFAHTDELASGSVAASDGTPDIELLPPLEPQLQPSALAVAAMLPEMTAAAESLATAARPALVAVAPRPAETVARTSALL